MMVPFEDRIQNPEFGNWVKSALTLDFARDPVKKFVEGTIVTSHKLLMKDISHICPFCTFKTACRVNSCNNEKLKKKIKDLHVKRSPTFDNTNPKDCWSQPWEFAKCFILPPGDRNIKTAADTDLSCLLAVIVNNQDFLSQAFISGSNMFKEARDVRNEIMHNPTFEVDEKKFQHYTIIISAMLKGLPDTAEKEFSLSQIDKLSKGCLQITAEDFARVNKEAIKSLQLLKTEVEESISGLSEMAKLSIKEIEDKKYGFLREGQRFIERKTLKGIKKIHVTAVDVITDIKCKAKDATYLIDEKMIQSRSELQTKAETVSTTMQMTLERAKKDLESVVNNSLENLGKDMDLIKKTTPTSKQNEICQYVATTQACIIKSVNLVKHVTDQCMESLHEQTNKLATLIRESHSESEYGKRKDIENKLIDLSDDVGKVEHRLNALGYRQISQTTTKKSDEDKGTQPHHTLRNENYSKVIVEMKEKIALKTIKEK